MTHAPRVRAFPKPVWIAVVVALPIIGPILWLVLGKAKPRSTKRYSGGRAPDDDPSFLGSLDQESPEDRIRRLEEELRKLDEEDPKDSPDEPETPPTKP